MTFKERLNAFLGKNQPVTGTKVQLVTERGNGVMYGTVSFLKAILSEAL